MGDSAMRLLDQELSPSELASLLLSVASTRAERVRAPRLLTRWGDDRFTRPASVDPRRLVPLEQRLWEELPDAFLGLELSPVAPLGVCSAVAAVAQSRIVTTVRGSEVVSDATNVLALEAASRRRANPASHVHLACCHRLLRGQDFGPGASAHFRLFQLASSARDQGSGRTEAGLLLAHLEHWATTLEHLLPASVSWHFAYTVFREGSASERFQQEVLPVLAERGVPMRELPERSGTDYYADLAFKIVGTTASGDVELGDGGLTDWTARLLGDAKERAMISCLATERLLALVDG